MKIEVNSFVSRLVYQILIRSCNESDESAMHFCFDIVGSYSWEKKICSNRRLHLFFTRSKSDNAIKITSFVSWESNPITVIEREHDNWLTKDTLFLDNFLLTGNEAIDLPFSEILSKMETEIASQLYRQTNSSFDFDKSKVSWHIDFDPRQVFTLVGSKHAISLLKMKRM